jgi:hypothetical protein
MMLPPERRCRSTMDRSGIEAPQLRPGDHPRNVLLDVALYWPVTADHPAQERR